MEVSHQPSPGTLDATIYRRTAVGQRELVAPSGRVGDDDTRLLSLLTGFTTLEALVTMWQPATPANGMIERLLAQGLVESVTAPAI